MQIQALTRKFIYQLNNDSIKLDDPGSHLNPQEVMDLYSLQYPELTTASLVGPVIEEDQQVYTFRTIIGSKG